MGGPTWFKFFGSEYLLDADVDSLPLEAQGILVRLWCLCSRDGVIPDDPKTLARRVAVEFSTMRKHWESLRKFFDVQEDGLHSSRMEDESKQYEEKCQKLRDRASKAGKASAAKRATQVELKLNSSSKQDETNESTYSTETEAEAEKDYLPNGSAAAIPREQRKRRRSREEITAGYPEQVRRVANAALREWRKEDPDGRLIQADLSLLVANLDLIFKAHPEASADLLIAAFKAYLAKEKFRYCAPQFFFGRGKAEDPAPWVAEYRFAQHQAQRFREAS